MVRLALSIYLSHNILPICLTEPVRSFEMEAVESNDESDNFNITCTALGVYPEPELRLFKVKSINQTLESVEIKSTVFSFKSMSDGFYSITLISQLDNHHHAAHTDHSDDHNLVPARERLALKRNVAAKKTSTTAADHYECRLAIANTDYLVIRRLAIQDGKSHFLIPDSE